MGLDKRGTTSNIAHNIAIKRSTSRVSATERNR